MNKRYAYFDIIKFTLIFFVVLGHVIEPFINNPFFKSIYMLIYSFHMPLFVFISGMFAKYNRKTIKKYLILFLIFHSIHTTIKLLTNTPPETTTEILSFILTPYWILWYLLCMVIWTFSLKFIKNVNIKLIVFFFMLSFLFGFIPINGILSINRLIYFYPFFLLGNLCGKDKEKFMNSIKSFKKPILIFISICFLVTLMFVFRYFAPNINISFFYGKSHYSSLSDFFGRFIAYFLGIACGFAVLLIIPDRHRTNSKFKSFSFSQIGSRTLSIYLLHIVFISLIKKIVSLITPDTGLLLVIFLTFTLIIVYLTSLPIFNKVLNKIA